MKEKIVAMSIMLLGINNVMAGEVTGNLKTTAKIENFCNIVANDVNFGVVNLPVTAQTASSEMSVLCSNNTPYKINILAGISSSGLGPGTYTYVITHNTNYNQGVKVYKNGVAISSAGMDIYCASENIYFKSAEAISFYGMEGGKIDMPYNSNYQKYDLCASNFMYASAFNQIAADNATRARGMKGAAKGDVLGYKITLPNDSTKIWIKGMNEYSAKGTGSLQKITVNAQILPEDSSSKYVAEDIYVDTLTAEVSY